VDAYLARLRSLCLGFTMANEKEYWGRMLAFRVRNKIFARYEVDFRTGGRRDLWCKAPPGVQQCLVGSRPDRYFVPPNVGHHGWVGIHLDEDSDWDEIARLVEDSHRMTAPRDVLEGGSARAGRALHAPRVKRAG
jgi:hypothetical protein